MAPLFDHARHRWLVLAGAFLWLGMVAWMSTSFFSSARTEAPVNHLLHALGLDPNRPPWDQAHYVVRKSAHVFEYMVLAVLMHASLRREACGRWDPRAAFMACLMACVCSMADEIHQAFTPDRTPLFTDCLLDTAGAVLGMGLVAGRHRLSGRGRNASAGELSEGILAP